MNVLAVGSAFVLLPCTAMWAAGAGPVLEMRTAAGQTTFHMGERIPLELSFSAAEEKRYEITTASYDRSGRMNYERFDVSPAAGWSDPLAGYFATGNYIGGGLSSIAVLSSKPIVIPFNLNEWIRFDQPGVYRVTVTSRRFTEPAKAQVWGVGGQAVTSNSIEVHIIAATPEWQRAKVNSILQELSAEPATQGMQPPKRTEAIADLRYLASAEAIGVMAAGIREDRTDMMSQCAFGLMGLPDSLRDAALEAMNKRIDDPHFPISMWFLTTMSVLQTDPHASPTTIQEERQRFMTAAWQSALSSLSRKEGKARADTVQTLMSFQTTNVTPEMKAQLASVLSASFLDLPEDRQTGQLLYNWDVLRSGTMLPALQALAKLPLENPGSNLSTTGSRRDLKSAALMRWYELDPEGAKREVLAEIGSAAPSLTAGALSFLPKQTLPQFEGIWAQALLQSSDFQQETVLAALMVRFGTGAAVPQVTDKLNKKVGEWACAPQAASLGYLVKFDPDVARGLLKRAIDARGPGKTGCNHALFQDVSTYASDPVLTEAALASLDDPDQQVTMDSLIYLMGYGTKEAEKPIWDRYVKWSDTWAGKGDVLEHREAGSLVGNWQEIGLGENLGRALIANQGWIADAGLISRVLQRCVGAQMCQQLKQIAAAAGPPYNVTLYRSGVHENYQVAQYSIKSLDLVEAKIEQFPQRTLFVLIPSSPQTGDQRALESEAQVLFARHGMTLKKTE